MPYILPEDRIRIDTLVDLLLSEITDAGHANYAISRLCHMQVRRGGLRYANCNNIIGTLECVKQELYRTVIAPYEDIKRKENGPVSEFDKEKTDVSSV